MIIVVITMVEMVLLDVDSEVVNMLVDPHRIITNILLPKKGQYLREPFSGYNPMALFAHLGHL